MCVRTQYIRGWRSRYRRTSGRSTVTTVSMRWDWMLATPLTPYRYPGPVIRRARETGGFSEYIRWMIDNYLFQRSVECPNAGRRITERPVTAEVPQGFVLGLLLWNIMIDEVLRVYKESDCSYVYWRYSHRFCLWLGIRVWLVCWPPDRPRWWFELLTKNQKNPKCTKKKLKN